MVGAAWIAHSGARVVNHASMEHRDPVAPWASGGLSQRRRPTAGRSRPTRRLWALGGRVAGRGGLGRKVET